MRGRYGSLSYSSLLQKVLTVVGYALLVFVCSCDHEGQSDLPSGYILHWADEFNEGQKPDPSWWSHEKGFIRNNELQWYQEDNAFVQNGFLVIEGRKETIENSRYDPESEDWRKNRQYASHTSSSINTRGKFSFKYGILEVRAKIDTSRGLWPAIWTLGIEKPWPANGEIDVMEFYRRDQNPILLANAAWEGKDRRTVWDEATVDLKELIHENPDWPEQFHVWKIHWTEDNLGLYLDDRLLNEVDLSITINPDAFEPFRQPHYILLNLAIGSNGGDPSEIAFPKRYLIDYVRVYQKK